MKALEKTITKLMGILNVSKSKLYVLNNLFIHNGFINITNLDTYIQITTSIKDTIFVNGDLFKKSLSILTSKTER